MDWKIQGTAMDVEDKAENNPQEAVQPDAGRREFVRKSGKALYLAPTLTLLASGPVSALPSEGPPPPPGAPAPPSP